MPKQYYKDIQLKFRISYTEPKGLFKTQTHFLIIYYIEKVLNKNKFTDVDIKLHIWITACLKDYLQY